MLRRSNFLIHIFTHKSRGSSEAWFFPTSIRRSVVQHERRRSPSPPSTAPIPLEQLVEDVYASSGPDTQKQMLTQLVDKVYETAPAPLQGLGSDEKPTMRSADVLALVEHALHAGGAALGRLTRVLTQTPSLAGSGAAAVLVALLRRTTQRRRVGDDTTPD